MNHPLSDMMTSTMAKIKDMIDVNTVIGDPITTPDGVTIIPVTKVSIGYGSGGSDFAMSSKQPDNCFGRTESSAPTRTSIKSTPCTRGLAAANRSSIQNRMMNQRGISK